MITALRARAEQPPGETRMDSTGRILRAMATVINTDGFHTGDQFAHHGALDEFGTCTHDQFDLCALAYIVAECEDRPAPWEFFTDEIASIRLIEASASAMAAIRAISDALDSEPSDTQIAPGVTVSDYIEHVSHWPTTAPLGQKVPPTTAEVIGRILRAADQATPNAA